MTPTIVCAIEETTAEDVVTAAGKMAEELGCTHRPGPHPPRPDPVQLPRRSANGRDTAPATEARRS